MPPYVAHQLTKISLLFCKKWEENLSSFVFFLTEKVEKASYEPGSLPISLYRIALQRLKVDGNFSVSFVSRFEDFFWKIRRNLELRSAIAFFLGFVNISLLCGLSGKVVDQSGEPVVFAKIITQKIVTHSDSSGLFFCEQNGGTVSILHPDYFPQTLTLPQSERPKQEVSFPQKKYLVVVLIKKKNTPPQKNQEVVAVNAGDDLGQTLKRRFYLRGHNLAGESQTLSLSGQKTKNSVILWENIPLNMSGQPLDIGNFGSLLCDSATAQIFDPASSEAIGGALNLHQNLSNRKRVVFLQNVGSYGLSRSLLQLDGFTQNYNYRFGYSRLQADNDYRYTDHWGQSRTRDNNRKKIDNLVFSLDAHNFKFRQLNIFFERELPGPTNERDYFTNAKSAGYRSVSALNYRQSYDWLEFSGDFGCNILQNRYDNSDAKLSGREQQTDYNFRAIFAKTELRTSWQNFTFSLPFSYKREDFSCQQAQNQQNAAQDVDAAAQFCASGVSGAFLHQTAWGKAFPKASFEVNEAGDFLPKASFLWELRAFSAGVSYRKTQLPPSFYDKFWQAGQIAQGNPDLLPEKGETYAYFLAWQGDIFESEIFYSNTKSEDLISWQRTFQGWKPFNIGASSTQFLSFSSKVKIGENFEFAGKVSRTIAKDRSDYDGKFIPYIPVGAIKATLGYRRQFFQLDVDYSAIGRQYTTRDQVNTAAYLEPYDFWDVRIASDFRKGNFAFSPQVKLLNILDERYSTFAFDPQPGFHWQAGLQIDYDFWEMQ